MKLRQVKTASAGILVLFGALLMISCENGLPGQGDKGKEIREEADLSNEEEKLSYALGAYFGNQLLLFKDLDLELFQTGLEQAYEDKTQVVLTEQQIGQIIVEGQQKAIAGASEKAQEEGGTYMKENSEKEGVTVLENGIQYNVISEGDGDTPKATDTVEVHYEGRLVNGDVFDSSYARNQTAVFPLEGVIVGWQEALKLMPVGSTWEVVIPPELAYGEQGSGRIGPNAVLIFKIELIDIKN